MKQNQLTSNSCQKKRINSRTHTHTMTKTFIFPKNKLHEMKEKGKETMTMC